MSRLHYVDVVGSVGTGGLTTSATTHTFTAPLTYANGTLVPTLTGTDNFLLSILNTAGTAVSEIVQVTSYNQGSGTATLVRGQEGTSGVTHASGDSVTMAVYASDLMPVATPAVIRGGKLTYVNGSTVNATLPTGSVAGDFVVIMTMHGYGAPTTPSGATAITPSGVGGMLYKTLTSTDITNGYIALTFAGSYQGQVSITGFVSASGIRSYGFHDYLNNSETASLARHVMTFDSTPQAGDISVYFDAMRRDGSNSGTTATWQKTATALDSRTTDMGYSAYLKYSVLAAPGMDHYFTLWSAQQNSVDQFGAIMVVKG